MIYHVRYGAPLGLTLAISCPFLLSGEFPSLWCFLMARIFTRYFTSIRQMQIIFTESGTRPPGEIMRKYFSACCRRMLNVINVFQVDIFSFLGVNYKLTRIWNMRWKNWNLEKKDNKKYIPLISLFLSVFYTKSTCTISKKLPTIE